MKPIRVLSMAALAVSLAASTLFGQCVGDCGGDGEVTINELLIMVNIALDNTTLADCEPGDANGDDSITVNEIIAAVNKALTSCYPDVSGVWQQDQVTITSSTCPPAITAIVQEGIATGELNCTFQIAQSGEHVTITATCPGEADVFDGTVDTNGQVTVSTTEQETVDSCTFALDETTTGVVTTSPTVGTHTMDFRFSPGCGFTNCTIVVRSRWTKIAVPLP